MTSTRSQRSGKFFGVGRDDRDGHARPAKPRIRRWISARAPTSTPRVGSSRISTLGSASSQRPMHDLLLITAAQAPDRSVDTSALIQSSRIARSTSALRRRRLISGSIGLTTIELEICKPEVETDALCKNKAFGATFFRHEAESRFHRPRRGFLARKACLRASSGQLSGRSAPKSRRASSLRPAPTRPPSPSTSPFFSSKLTLLTFGASRHSAHGDRDLVEGVHAAMVRLRLRSRRRRSLRPAPGA